MGDPCEEAMRIGQAWRELMDKTTFLADLRTYEREMRSFFEDERPCMQEFSRMVRSAMLWLERHLALRNVMNQRDQLYAQCLIRVLFSAAVQHNIGRAPSFVFDALDNTAIIVTIEQ